MDDERYGDIVAQNRSLIVKQWSLLSDMSPANAAYELTQHAIAKGFVQPRPPVKGELMKGWCINNTAPLWACKSALSLCLLHGWQPADSVEWAVFSYLYIRIQPYENMDDLLNGLPASLAGLSGLPIWLKTANEDKETFRKQDKK